MKLHILITLLTILSALILPAEAGDKSGETVKRHILSTAGGSTDSSSHYRLSGSMAQPMAGRGVSNEYNLGHGFWRGLAGVPCDCRPGNVNGDSTINIFDATYLISYLYIEGTPPIPYELCNGDPNNDCVCNIFDITYIIDFLYRSGPPPATCEDWMSHCGLLAKR